MRHSTPTRQDVDSLCARTAARQHGVFNYRQARASGLTASGLNRRVQSGKLTRVMPTVYMVAGAPESWRSNLMAACLWGGDETSASFRAAAALWGFEGYPSGPLEISTTCEKRPHGLPLLVHRMDRWLVPEIVAVGGIPATTVRRTLLDLAGCGDLRVERALDQSLLRNLTSMADLWLLYDQEWTLGRRGVARLRVMLIERTPDLAPSHSELEARMRALIRSQNLPQPRFEYPVRLPCGVVHIDIAYPGDRLAIELDGYSWHSDREAFERDRERDNQLQALSWTVLRFTWAKLRWEPGRVVDTIKHHLRSAPAEPRTSSRAAGPRHRLGDLKSPRAAQVTHRYVRYLSWHTGDKRARG